MTFPHSDPDALAGAVSTLLSDEAEAKRMAKRARRMVRDRYGWSNVATLTTEVYRSALRETSAFDTRQAEAMLSGRPTIVVPDGNLLEGVHS